MQPLQRFQAEDAPQPLRIAIRHTSDDEVVALLGIVSRANKDRPRSVHAFAVKVKSALRAGIHVLVIDILRPSRSDSSGMHGSLWQRFAVERYRPPVAEPLTLASYVADPPHYEAYVGGLAFGSPLPDMPLFLTPEYSVSVPLDATCATAWTGTPRRWRDALEASN